MNNLKLIIQNISSIIYFDSLKEKSKIDPYLISGAGSGWQGFLYDKNILDLGQRYFELGFENNEEKDLKDYETTASQRDYIHHIKKYFSDNNYALRQVKIEAFYENKIIKCPLETTDLSEIFKLLSSSKKKEIIDEISSLETPDIYNMESIYSKNIDQSQISLEKIYNFNHGKIFNDLIIFPFIKKFNINLDEIPLNLRRKIWAPVFFKKTIIDFLNGNKKFKPYRPHYKIVSKSTSSFISEKINNFNLKTYKDIKSLNDKHIVFNDNSEIQRTKTILGLPILKLANYKKNSFITKKNKIRILWFYINKSLILKEIDYLSIIDLKNPILRISTSSYSNDQNKLIYCIETFNMELLYNDIYNLIINMGLIRENIDIELIRDLSADVIEQPTFENRNIFNQALFLVKNNYSEDEISLSVKEFGKNTFNDQFLIGLKEGSNK